MTQSYRHQPAWIMSIRGGHKQVRPGFYQQYCTRCGAIRDWHDGAARPRTWSKPDCK
mgnify:FL=1